MLEVRDLALAVPGRLLCADLNVRFQAGEVWGILGANGAGKTTLLHALAGLRAPDGGEVRWAGQPLAAIPRRRLAQERAVLLQDETELFWGTALDWVCLGRYPHGGTFGDPHEMHHARAALAQVGAAQLAGRNMATLSGGERQRVRLAMVLAQQARALLLDEPLKHLDLAAQFTLLERLSSLARRDLRLLVMVLHDVYWVSRYCDKVLLVFGDGRVLHGDCLAVLTQENMESVYGCALQPVEAAAGRLFLPTAGAPSRHRG
ncbi:ABC transporter ATP-binding protein [Thiobacter aerophilum]|uniref:ABC transporter ATP-binding protein n=1 Tax=Thiobacter aerophilum TaxID=3121275 RepID=A0ABV0EEP5_9BURK